MARRGGRKYKRIFDGISISTPVGGVGYSTSLVKSDSQYLQETVDFVDDKRAFFEDIKREYPDHVVESVKEVRKLALANKSLVDSQEAADVLESIRAACQRFMTDYHPKDSDLVLIRSLDALRRVVFEEIAIVVNLYSLKPPVNINLQDVDVEDRLGEIVGR